MLIANVLTEAKDPSAFVVMMALFFFFGWFCGFITVRFTILRWLGIGLFGVTIVQNPHLPIAWEFPTFYIFWGYVGAYLSPYRNKFFSGDGFALTLPNSSGSGSRFLGSLWYLIKQPFKALWWTFKNLVDLIFIRIPIYLIRIAYWLKVTIPMLGKTEGWLRLLRGIGTFLWLLVPWMVRAEWNRLFRGKDFGDTRSDEFKRRYNREKKKHERREEWRSRSLFSELEEFMKQSFRKERTDPFPGGTPNSDQWTRAQKKTAGKSQGKSRQGENQSEQSASDDFWGQQRRKAQSEQGQKRKSSGKKNSASPRSSSSQKQSRQTSEDYWEKQKQASSSNKKKSSHSQNHTDPKPRPKPKPTPEKDPDPMSREFYEKHRAVFEKSGWKNDPTEDRFGSGKSLYAILDLPSNADRAQIKKAKIRFARQYMPFTNLNHSIPVQARANAILAETNGAVDTLLKGKR